MISQYIYSRTTAGYFSKSHTADSTTVTIGKVFLREEQARMVAEECAKISTLEDTRPVPRISGGGYRGMLRVRRLSKMLTVVSRSYRLPSSAGQQGESRDFTYTTSYILSDEEKERFLQHPEYMMNLQNFEDFQSVMRRIAESSAVGKGGKIEANPNYSLFNGEYSELTLDLFQKAGFNRTMFAQYIASVIEKVSHHRYSGRENEKVLLILPNRYNQPWGASGGNQFEEAILTATMKVLPRCVSGQLNAATCGMDRPDSAAFAGIQLVFMDPGYVINPSKNEYAVIDLEHQISNVSADLDTRYAEFIWDNLQSPEKLAEFEEKYYSIFERSGAMENDNSLEKFSYIFKLEDIENTGLSDKILRNKMLAELLAYVGSAWTQNSIEYASRILEEEANHPTYDKNLEKALADYVKRPDCPDEIKEKMSAIIIRDILNGSKEQASIDFVVAEVKSGNTPVIQTLSEACMDFMKKEEFANCVTLIKILATQLENSDLDDETRGNIYDNIWYLLMHGSEEDTEEIKQIIREEEQRNAKNSLNMNLLWEAFKKNITNETSNLTPDVIWFLSQFSLRNEEYFLEDEWLPLYEELLETRARKNQKQLLVNVRDNLVKSINTKATVRKLNVLEESEKIYIAFAEGKFDVKIDRIRSDIELLSKDKNAMRAVSFLVYAYQQRSDEQKRKTFIERLSNQEKWMLIYFMAVKNDGDPDENINSLMERSYNTRKEFLNIYAAFPAEDEEQCTRAADVYFYFMNKAVSRSSDPNLLLKWTKIYAQEKDMIRSASRGTNFAEYIHARIKEELEQATPDMIKKLPEESIRLLDHERFLPLNAVTESGEDFHALDLLAEIYRINASDNTESFMPLRTKIRQEETNLELYRNALEHKVRALRNESINDEISLNIALLLGQMDMRINGTAMFRTENVAERVYGTSSAFLLQRVRLQLLDIISRYGYEGSSGMYDCQRVRDQLYNDFAKEVRNRPQTLENKEVWQCYRNLDVNIRDSIRSMIRENLQPDDLDEEWLNRYGIQRPRRKNPTPRQTAPRAELPDPNTGYDYDPTYDPRYDQEDDKGGFPVKIIAIAAAAVAVIAIAVVVVLLLLNRGGKEAEPEITPTPVVTVTATPTPEPTATPTPEPTATPTPVPEPTLIPVDYTASGTAVYTINAVYTATVGANIRSDANTSSGTLGNFTVGQTLTVTGVTENDASGHLWYRFNLENGETVQSGFVREDMIEYQSGDAYPEAAIAARKAAEGSASGEAAGDGQAEEVEILYEEPGTGAEPAPGTEVSPENPPAGGV